MAADKNPPHQEVIQLTTDSDELLKGFVDKETIERSRLLDVDKADLSDTTIVHYELGDQGYFVRWKVEYSPLQKMIDIYLRFFVSSGIFLLFSAWMFFVGNFGGYLTGIVCLGGSIGTAFWGFKLLNQEYVFNLGIDSFTLTIKDVFEKKRQYDYSEMKNFEIMPTGMDDNWGLSFALHLKNDRLIIKGRPHSIKLLKGLLEVFLKRINASRKKLGKEEMIQLA